MTTTVKPLYNTSVALTITLASLATSTTQGRGSASVDNTSALAVDALVQSQISTGTSPTGGGTIEIWAYGNSDSLNAGNFSGNMSGADQLLTPKAKANMRLLEVITVTATSNVSYISGPYSIANAFGGTMPRLWGVWILNNTGVALNATAANHVVDYTPVQYQNI